MQQTLQINQKSKKMRLVRRTCQDVEEIWNTIESKDTSQHISENLDIILDTLEGLKVAKGSYMLGKRPVVLDYFVLALIMLLKEIYGDLFSKALDTKPHLKKWIHVMTYRPNLTAYLQRPRTLPITTWKFTH